MGNFSAKIFVVKAARLAVDANGTTKPDADRAAMARTAMERKFIADLEIIIRSSAPVDVELPRVTQQHENYRIA